MEKPNDTSGSTRADREKVVGQTSEDRFRLLVEGVKDYAIVRKHNLANDVKVIDDGQVALDYLMEQGDSNARQPR